ncbi:MAG: gliding motility-associated C-terminal domain-containing protein [Flavobacteriales bacterium]
MNHDDITGEIVGNGISCFGICDGSIEVSNVTGGTGVDYSYSLTPVAGNCVAPCLGNAAVIENLCAGSFTLNITDEEGCVKNFPNIVVAGPAELIIQLTPTNVQCFGQEDGMVVINSTGGTGQVVLTPTSDVLPQTITNLAPGTYTYTIEDENGCQAIDDVTITEPDLLVSTLDETINVTCGGDCDGIVNYTVTGGTAPFAYTLDPTGAIGVSNGTIGTLCANAYVLTIVDSHACTTTMEFDINEPTPLDITFNVDAPTCTGMTDGSAQIVLSGGTGDLTGFVSADGYDAVDNGNNSFLITNLGETTIDVQLIDEVGCVIEESFEVIPDIITDMILTTFSSPETCWNEQDGTATVGVQNGFLPISYQWDDPNEQITATAIGLSSSETYTVRVTDDIGCTLTTSVFVDPTIGCFFITTGITPNGDGVNDTWLIGGLEFFPNAKVQVFNRWGQIVFESRGYNSPWDGRYKGEALPVADYYFVIEYDNTKDPILGTVTIKY